MAVTDPKRQSDGFLSLEAGVNQGVAPNLVPRNQAVFAVNTTMRGGWPTPRPGWIRRPLTFGGDAEVEAAFKSALFQTAAPYLSDNGLGSGISMHGGRIFKTNINDFSVQEITIPGDPNPSNIQRAWAIQAENFWLLQDGQSKVYLYNGGSARRLTNSELPVGKQMVYHMGRVGVANGKQYVFGDIVYGPPSNDRASILGMTENQYLSQGGAFMVPMDAGNIVGLKSIANINTALGQGPLVVFTESGIFATVLPQDRAVWQTLTQPIQTIIQLETGGVSQDSIVNVNEDLYYRTDIGIQSLAYAVRNNGQPGNTPISNEVGGILSSDSRSFLQYSSGVNFDNRMLMTCSPAISQGHGIYHRGLVVLDFDLITAMREKFPPAWEGLWTGLNILKILRVRHNHVIRCFAYILNSNNEIDLWELTRSNLFDNDGTENLRIEWSIDTRSMDFGSKFDSNQLFSGDVFIDNVSGEVNISLQYIPDSYPCPIDWDSWSECAKVELCVEDMVACQALPNFRPQYRPNHQLKQPADTFDPILKKLHRVAYEFGFRFNNVGYFRMKQFRANTYQTQQLPYGSQL